MRIKKVWAILSAVFLILSVVFVILFKSTSTTADIMKNMSLNTESQNQCIGYDSAKGILIVGTHDNKAIAYDSSNKKIWELKASAAVCQIRTNSSTRKVYISDSTGKIYILNMDTGSTQKMIDCGTRTYGFAVTSDGSRIIISAGPNAMKHYLFYYDGSGNRLNIVSIGITCETIDLSSDQKSVYLGDDQSEILQYDMDGKEIKKASLGYPVKSIQDIPRTKQLVAITEDGGFHLYNEDLTQAASGQVNGKGTAVAASEDGKYVAMGTDEGYFYILKNNGKQIYFKQASYPISDIQFTSNMAYVTGYGDFMFTINLKSLSTVEFFSGLKTASMVLVILFPICLIVSLIKTFESAEKRVRKIGHVLARHKTAYIMLLPTFALLLIFNYYTAVIAFIRAFTDWSRSSTSLADIHFIGFQNFVTMVTEGYFYTGVVNLLLIIITSFIKILTVPLLVAKMVFAMRSDKEKYWFRFLFVLPMVVPGVVSALMWQNMYDPNIGLINQLLSTVHLKSLEHVWLGDPSTAIWAIIFMGFPFVDAFAFLVYYGGLINIPSSLFEAAKVDGSNAFWDFFKIQIPLLRPQFKLLIVLTFIGSVQNYTNIYLLTQGGPGSATYVPGLELYYNATKFGRYGYACALGVVLFVVIFAGTIVNMKMKSNSDAFE